MVDKDQIRKIQFTGKSSYIVSLPKDWIKDQGLKQGDQVTVGRNGSTILEVKPISFGKTSVDESSNLVISPEKNITRRQDTPKVYDMTTVAYVTNPKFVLENESIFSGKVRHVHIPIERALDIDTPFDFRIAELLLSIK